MPVVPYKPVPDQAISQQAISPISVPTPLDAFGGSIAEAIGSSGKVFEHAGNEIFHRAIALQQLQNESEAEEADANYTLAMGTLRANYHSLEGKDAVAQFPQFQTDARNIRDTFASTMSNPMSKKLFDKSSRGLMVREVFAGAGHAATQNRRYSETTALDQMDNLINNGLNDQSPGALNNTRQVIRQTAEKLAGLRGLGPESVNRFERENNSKMLVTALRGIAEKDPVEAQRFFDEHREDFDDKHIDSARQVVKTNLYRVQSLRIANEVNDQPIEGGENLETRIKRAREIAREQVPGDLEFESFVTDQTITKYNKMAGVRREAHQERQDLVNSALMGRFGNGAIPTTVDELRNTSPEVKAAWDSMRSTDQKRFMADMAKLSKGDRSWNSDRINRWKELRGMALEDPVQFASINMTSEDLPYANIRQLVDQQIANRKRSGGDPRIQPALSALRTIINGPGLELNRPENRTRYNQFVGGLEEALEVWQKNNPNKVPKREDYIQMGRDLIQQQADYRETFWGMGLSEPGKIFGVPLFGQRSSLFELSLPQQLQEELTRDPRQGGEDPTPERLEQWRREYVRQRFQELQKSRTPK